MYSLKNVLSKFNKGTKAFVIKFFKKIYRKFIIAGDRILNFYESFVIRSLE